MKPNKKYYLVVAEGNGTNRTKHSVFTTIEREDGTNLAYDMAAKVLDVAFGVEDYAIISMERIK